MEMKKSIIGELIVSAAVALAACGALADGISFGDTYWLEEAKWKAGDSEIKLKKRCFADLYTGHTVMSPSKFNQIAIFEVVGAKSKDEIKPIVENLGFAGSLSASVWTDEELRKKAMPPLSTASKWESEIRWVDLRDAYDFSGPDGEYLDTFCWAADPDDPLSEIVCEYESKTAAYGWPGKLWPENKAVAGRFWVAVELFPSASSRWYGLEGSVRVWQQGTNEKSERFYVGYDPDDTVPFATDARSMFRGLTINTKFTCMSAEIWDVDLVSYNAPLHAYWLETSASQCGAPLSISLPEAGIFYMSSVWLPEAEDITAKNADGQWSVRLSYDDDEAWEKYYEMGNENFFYEYGRPPYGSPGYIAVRVNSGKTITLEREDIDDDFDFFRLQFFPSSSKAVAVEASYFTIFDRNRYKRYGGNTCEYLQGYVTGTGVYKVGEMVALAAVPAPGEAFDHWELKYGNFPAGIDTANPTLSFMVTDDCAGTAEERKQMVVRAVWKEKRQITATAVDISQGCATGSGFYHDGAIATLTAKPTARYQFVRWSDGVTTETRTVAVDGDAEYVAEFERREVPVFESIAGDKVEYDIELKGYAATGLPAGLKYDAKKGVVSGVAKTPGEYEVTFTKSGEADETMIFTVRDEVVSVGCEGLSAGSFVAGVAGDPDGIPLEIETETGLKSVAVAKLPAGMKYDAKTNLITGAPTKAGDYEVTVTVTTKSGAKQVIAIPVAVAALPDAAVGTFNGFVKSADEKENIGTFQLTATDVGKLSAKVTTAAGTYSFSGACWDSVEENFYGEDRYFATLTTKKGEKLELALDSFAGWDETQLFAWFATADGTERLVEARKNAFGKTWYFNAEGDVDNGWTLSYAENAKAAALTVTLNADGSTKIAGKLGELSVNAAGYADVTSVSEGAIIADFVPVVSVKKGKSTLKRALSIGTTLWFDRSNNHDYVGSACLQE